MKRALVVALALVPQVALADHIWWSFPRDDQSAIEVDEHDIHASDFEDQDALLRVITKCNLKKGKQLVRDRDRGIGIPLREVRILKGDKFETRCVMPLATWRARLGKRLVERLEDELDAHMSFLYPRKTPQNPGTAPTDGGT